MKAQAVVIFEVSHKEKNYHFVVPAGAPYEEAEEAISQVITDIKKMKKMAEKGAAERKLEEEKKEIEILKADRPEESLKDKKRKAAGALA